MTLNEAITRVQRLKPSQYDLKTLVQWISDLEGVMYAEIVSWHENTDDVAHGPYSETDMDAVLMAPDPYSEVYTKWLEAQIDYYNAEYSRYNNSMMMYNVALSNYSSWYCRSNVPKRTNVTI